MKQEDRVKEALQVYRKTSTPEQKQKDWKKLEIECLTESLIQEPLFTLTAEEVENLKPLVENIVSRIAEGGSIITLIPNDDLKPFMDNLLTRIKQWQDEIQKQAK